MNKEDLEKMLDNCLSCGLPHDCKIFQLVYIDYLKVLISKLDDLSNRLNNL